MVYLASCFLCRRCLSPYVRHFLPPSCTGQQNIKLVGRMQKCHPERGYFLIYILDVIQGILI